MKRSYPLSKTTAPSKINYYKKLSTMTDKEIQDSVFTAHQLVRLIGQGVAAMQVLRILRYHPHLINGKSDGGRSILMSALHKGKINLVEGLLQKNADPYQKSATKFGEELTPTEFVQKILNNPSNTFGIDYGNLLTILHSYQDVAIHKRVSSSSETITSAGKQSIRFTSRAPALAVDPELKTIYMEGRRCEKLNNMTDQQISSECIGKNQVATSLIPISAIEQSSNQFSGEMLADYIQTLEEECHFESPFELSPAVAFLPSYEMQNQGLGRSNMDDLFTDFNNGLLIAKQSHEKSLLYNFGKPIVNQSNIDYLIENFGDSPKNKP